MKTYKLYIVAALLGTVLAGCQMKELDFQPVEGPNASAQTWTLTVEAAQTKAMSLAGTTLSTYWTAGEKVAVYKADGTKIGTLLATPGEPSTTATLKGELTVDGIAAGNTIYLLFPGRDDNLWTYQGQDGSAPSESGTMATSFDYATASLTIDTVDDVNHVLTVDSKATFKNQQSVFRFGFKVGGAGEPIAVSSFTVSAAEGKLVRSRAFSAGSWASTFGSVTVEPTTVPGNLYYTSLRNENTTTAEVLSFSVIRSSDSALLEGTKDVPVEALGDGLYLTANVSVSQKTLAPSATTISDELEVL